MLKNVVLILALLTLVSSIVACNSNGVQSEGRIEATWIEPEVLGDTVSISVSEVDRDRNVHFNLKTEDGDMNFMAYVLDGEIHVRANVCPPCQSIGFSLDGDILVCNRCATKFKAQTGEGISGACVDFPKASVTYEISGDDIVMDSADLATAYQNTLEPGPP